SVLLAAAIGIPLAFLFEWFEFPGRKLLGSLIALPAVLPPLVGVIAFLFLYGESGFVARGLQYVFRFQQAPWQLQGPGAILLVHAYSMYVYFYLFTRAGLAKVDAAMIEAAHALGAGRWRTLFRVTLPLLRPSLAGATLLTFMTALGSFSAPYVFGGGFRVMPTQIVASRLNGEDSLAMVETVALALMALIGLVLLRRSEGDGDGGGVGARGRAASAPFNPDSGLARPIRNVDNRSLPSGVEPGQLSPPSGGAGPARAAGELSLDGGGKYGGGRGPGPRGRVDGGEAAGAAVPDHRGIGGAAVGVAGDGFRDRAGDHVQRNETLRGPLGVDRNGGDPPVGLSGTEYPGDGPGDSRRVSAARSGIR